MPKKVKKQQKIKKEKIDLLQMQTDQLVNKKKRKVLPPPSESESESSCDSFHGFSNASVSQADNETSNIRSQMLDLQKKLDEIEAKKDQKTASLTKESEISTDEDNTNKQLFGKDYKDEEMVLLKDEIYCRKRIFDMAKGCSFKPSHVARRLIEGVYKKEAILKSTLTGQPPKSQGRERLMAKYDCLDPKARSAIVSFSIDHGKKKGWPAQNEYEINRALSQKIGELKRLYNR